MKPKYALTLFIWMLMSSFKSNVEIELSPPTLVPLQWHPENYRDAWMSPPSTFGRYYFNSVFLAIGGAVIGVPRLKL